MISINEPQLATFQAKELIKHIARLYGERKQYKKTLSIEQKQQETQTDSNYFKCIISNFNETSEI